MTAFEEGRRATRPHPVAAGWAGWWAPCGCGGGGGADDLGNSEQYMEDGLSPTFKIYDFRIVA